MRELVLGGEGLIGSELVKSLVARGHSVVSLDIKSGCDLRYAEDKAFKECDRVWFLAWDTGGSKYLAASNQQHQMFKHNCELSARVFDILDRTKRPFLFTTSQLAGQHHAYGLTKLMSQQWATQLGGKVACLWNTYGWEKPDERSHVITDFVLSGLVEGQVKCRTNGKERRRFIYKSDCVAALMNFFDSSETEADIAGQEWLTIRHIAEVIAQQLNVEANFGDLEGNELLIDPKKMLHQWKSDVSLIDGISMVIAEARLFLEGKYMSKYKKIAL